MSSLSLSRDDPIVDDDAMSLSELDEDDDHPGAGASSGQGAVDLVVSRAAELAKKSEKAWSSTKSPFLSPCENESFEMWKSRATQLREKVFRVDGNTPLTAEQIYKTIWMISTSIVDARPDKQPLSVGWAREGIRYLRTWGKIHSNQFHIDAHGSVKLEECITSLVKENILSFDQQVPTKPVTVSMLDTLVQRYLRSTLSPTTDELLAVNRKIAVVALVLTLAATAARSGDLSLSLGYDKRESPFQYLQWRDLSLALHRGPSDKISIDGQISIHCQKGMKESRSDNRKRVVTIKSCSIPYLCPLNYLMIMAIRFGAVDARTFDELCNKTLAKTVPLVDWVHPLRPVFPQFSTSCEVQLDKPSTRGSTSWAVKNFTAAVGLKERFKPHDLRHGAGVDVNNLQDLPVRNEFHTREALGHSWQALQNGTTHKYSGDQKVDYWNLRVAQQRTQVDDHNPLQTAIRMLPKIVDDTSIASPILDFKIPSLHTPTASDIAITPAATSASTPPATTTGIPSIIAPTDVDDAGIKDWLGFSEEEQIDDPAQEQLENAHKLDLPKSTTLFIDYFAKLPERARPRSKKPMFGEAQPGKFNCPDDDCDRAFKTAKQLVSHINLNHPGTPIPDNANEEIIRPIKCDICGRRFTDSGRLQVHATSCSRKRSAPPPHDDDDDDDDVSMPSLSKGSGAVDKASVEQNKKPKLEVPVDCPIAGCNKTYKKKGNLLEHINTFHKQLRCEVCNKTYGGNESLKKHLAKLHSYSVDDITRAVDEVSKAFASPGQRYQEALRDQAKESR